MATEDILIHTGRNQGSERACLLNDERGTRNDELQTPRLEFIVPRSSFQNTLHEVARFCLCKNKNSE